jgi:hypothetical protein
MGFSNTGIFYCFDNFKGRVGSCALSVLIHDNKLYSANIGDCKGVFIKILDNFDLRK